MGDFFEINSKAIVKLYINQVAMSVFGIMVIMGLGVNDMLIFFLSLFAVGLYLVIIYSMMWEQGAKAASKTLNAKDAGVRKIYTPFMIVLFGSVFNIVTYTTYTVLKIYVYANNIPLVAEDSSAVSFGGLMEIVIKMTNAIYMGFESLLFRENVIMRTPPYYFFLTLIPLFAVGIVAYYLGGSEISILRKLGINIKNKKTSNTHINYKKYK